MSVPDPVTRKEMYLNKAATGSGSIPDPVTREEMYLAEIANGGGGGDGGGALIVNIVNPEEGDPYLDKTAGEILSAIQSGKTIMICIVGDDEAEYFMLQNAYYSGPNPHSPKPMFIFCWVDSSGRIVTARSEDTSDYPTVTYE